MRDSDRQFVFNANRRHRVQRVLISILCILSLLVGSGVSLLLTMPGLTASLDPAHTGGVTELVTDNPTHNGWIKYFGQGDQNLISTEFAGGVWVDKSVFSEPYVSSTGTQIPIQEPDGMLAILSAIGSSMAITGRIYTPTDVMLILDMSSSMYPSLSPTTVRAMVAAVNDSIATLLSLNSYNRVGVTIYYGGGDVTVQSNTNHSYVMLPLDRYTPVNGSYITAHVSSSKLTAIRVTSGVKNSAGNTMPTTGHNVSSPAGTYAQLGILHAMDQFLKIPSDDVSITMMDQQIDRQPIFVFMSDGEPTAATTQFTTKSTAQFGNNQVASRSPNETDFVTQLTAAYAKEKVAQHYNLTPLYYTLGLGTSLSYNVMDPSNNTTSTINSYWEKLVNNGEVSFKSAVYQADWSKPTLSFTVKKTDNFPTSVSQRLFVDAYYGATDSSQLSSAFESIVNEIILKSIYTPTYTGGSDVNQSGEVSFLDELGEYMAVTDMKGLLIGGTLYDGSNLAKNFVAGGKDEGMGSFEEPTDLGWAFHLNVLEQLGLEKYYEQVPTDGDVKDLAHKATTELIRKAYAAGQLKYDSETGAYSNYIGWYADDSNAYLGFWDGSDPKTDPNRPAGATQVIKAYFYQGVTRSENQYTLDTDMMYATVWVRRDIVTQHESVVFSVPASLLPTLKYFVKLSPEGELESLALGAPDNDAYEGIRPIRLVYEVGLREDINAGNIYEKVDQAYLDENYNHETGELYFYSNDWERDKTTGYGKVNTYSYFRPSKVNDRYYYTADAPLYLYDPVADDYIPYTGDKPVAAQDLYSMHTRYVRNADAAIDQCKEEIFYLPTSDAALTAAVQDGEGQWYIPAGTIHNLNVNDVNRFASYKSSDSNADGGDDPNWQMQNYTGTLDIVNEPFVDDGSRSALPAQSYIVGATLGNNGRITLVPKGQTLQKLLVESDGTTPNFAEKDMTFRFLIHEGEALEDYSDGQTVMDSLAGKKISVIELQVREGYAESGKVPLTGLTEHIWKEGDWCAKSTETPTWDCLFDHTYTLVELPCDGRYDIGSISGSIGAYQFQYGVHPEGETDHTIYATNRFVPWTVNLEKIDSYQTDNKLPGAVFGLYSPVADDGLKQLPEEYPYGQLTADYQGTTWYLTQIKTTDQTGKLVFEGLKRENYLLLELQQPDGYQPPVAQNARLLARSDAPDLRSLPVTVSNTPGVELPETGGAGASVYIFVGMLIMLISVVLMIVYFPKRKEEPASQ